MQRVFSAFLSNDRHATKKRVRKLRVLRNYHFYWFEAHHVMIPLKSASRFAASDADDLLVAPREMSERQNCDVGRLVPVMQTSQVL